MFVYIGSSRTGLEITCEHSTCSDIYHQMKPLCSAKLISAPEVQSLQINLLMRATRSVLLLSVALRSNSGRNVCHLTSFTAVTTVAYVYSRSYFLREKYVEHTICKPLCTVSDSLQNKTENQIVQIAQFHRKSFAIIIRAYNYCIELLKTNTHIHNSSYQPARHN